MEKLKILDLRPFSNDKVRISFALPWLINIDAVRLELLRLGTLDHFDGNILGKAA